MISRRRFVTTVPSAILSASLPIRAQSRRTILGAWVGAVTADTATIKVLTPSPGLQVSLTMPELVPVVEHSAKTDRDGVAVFVLRDLSPRTRYRYVLSSVGEPPLDGSFRTFAEGHFSFRAVFSSCASTGSTSSVFTAMRQMEPDLFIHMGDLHYENITNNDPQRFRQAYGRVLASSTQAALFRSVPIAYTWDDHDFGTDNSDRTAPSRPAAQRAFRSFVPHYRLEEGDGPIYHAFTMGRVRIIMIDTRSERVPVGLPEPERTMLGSDQLEWLEGELKGAAEAPLTVLVNTVPWITKRNERTDEGWAQYARERRHIADLIVRHGLTRKLVMLSGDAHMLAMDDGTNSQYSTLPEAPKRGFVIAHAAPLDRWPRNKGGPYSHREVASNGQFGVMDVKDEGGAISVRLRGMRGTRPVPGQELTFQSESA